MKIYIVGSVGSGKTTLARQLAQHYRIPHFETDNFVWTRNHQGQGDIRNSVEKRDELLKEAVNLDQWIIEGVHIDWTDPGLEASDYIIFLDIPVSIRYFRITKRYARQVLRLEEANYQPTFSIFLKMFQWTSYFEKQMKPEFLTKFSKYEMKVVLLTKNDSSVVQKNI
ncbi:AAA family ATPase [Psychrobacillus sp. FSL K6-2843]|uniref:AAA family ATPase n=1 Tax=Psychrobacillus sp. FSL K6-2843 TaxID=2921549 RepID=UPI0012B03A3C|nr:AAA family ATPase [Bacillus sp. N3536]